MYPLDNEIIEKFKQSNYHLARLTIDGESMVITEANIIQGGLSINRYCTSSDMIELGSTVSAELSVVLDNHDGVFNDIMFNGREIYVEIGVYNDDTDDIYFMPTGYFTVDGSPRKLEQITISALDRMMRFDKTINPQVILFPYTVSELLTTICQICNVELGINPSELLFANYSIPTMPETVTTYRELLSAICEITGTCAFIDYQGKLILKWYEETDTVITMADRYSSDIYEEPIEITGVQVLNGEDIYAAGEEGYIISVENNPLIQSDWQNIANGLNSKLSGFTYTPFSASVLSMPHLYPLDMITFVDKEENEIPTIITDWTFKLYTNTELRGRGETVEKMGYGSSYSYTKDEVSLIQKLSGTSKDSMAFYESRNASAYTIADGSRKRIVYMKMATNSDTRVQIHIEINLFTADTDSNDYTRALCTYVVNGDEVTTIYPTETYIDGNHVLHLMYIMPMSKNTIAYFAVFMEADSGDIFIPKGGIWCYASGLGLVGDGTWDGTLDFYEETDLIPIPGIGFDNSVTDAVVISRKKPVGASLEDVISDISVRNVEIQPVTDICLLTRYEGAYERLTEDGDNRLTEEDDVRYTESEV